LVDIGAIFVADPETIIVSQEDTLESIDMAFPPGPAPPKPSPAYVATGSGGKPGILRAPFASASRPVQEIPSGPDNRIVSKYLNSRFGEDGLATVAPGLGVKCDLKLVHSRDGTGGSLGIPTTIRKTVQGTSIASTFLLPALLVYGNRRAPATSGISKLVPEIARNETITGYLIISVLAIAVCLEDWSCRLRRS
jgi:hypothetical protein